MIGPDVTSSVVNEAVAAGVVFFVVAAIEEGESPDGEIPDCFSISSVMNRAISVSESSEKDFTSALRISIVCKISSSMLAVSDMSVVESIDDEPPPIP